MRTRGRLVVKVLAFSQSLHKELAEKNVRIQVVLPGATATNFWDAAGGSLERVDASAVRAAAIVHSPAFRIWRCVSTSLKRARANSSRAPTTAV